VGDTFMITIQKLNSENALAYLTKCLAGGNALSRLVLEQATLEQGDVYAALPRTIDNSTLKQFEWGGVCSLTLSRQLLVSMIMRYLKGQARTVVFEDSLAKPADPVIRRNPHHLNVWNFRSEVYYYLTQEDIASAEKVELTIDQAKDSSTKTYIGYFISAIVIPGSRDQELDMLLSKIDCIIIGAFDRESFLLWQPFGASVCTTDDFNGA
jgi:hypothetical protein